MDSVVVEEMLQARCCGAQVSQTNWVKEVSAELCGVTPMLVLKGTGAARHPADFDSVSNRWCPDTGHVTRCVP